MITPRNIALAAEVVTVVVALVTLGGDGPSARLARERQRAIVVSAASPISNGALAVAAGNSANTPPTLTPSDSDEIALGAALLVQFDNERGVAASPQSKRIEAYLQRVADSLGRHTKRKLPWHIHYDSHPGIKSGFALPGGHIVLWGGAIAYMSTEDELAAIIAHEIAHTDEGQVNKRIDSLVATKNRSVKSTDGWNWREFGATYGETLEKVCDFEGAKLAVKTGYSPLGLKMLLESFIALGTVHAPSAPPSQAIVDRIDQIKREIASEHWETLTTTRPLRLPG